MCVLAFAFQADPQWPVVLAGNRDERHDRPSEPLHRWPDAPAVLAGRDSTAGGTWLGVSEQGRIASVTNVRGAGAAEGRPSRGWLVRDLLLGEGRYAVPSPELLSLFNPVNLVLLTSRSAAVWSNASPTSHLALPPGIHGLSNDPLGQPTPREARLKAGVAAWLAGGDRSLEPLLRLLADDEPMAENGGAVSAPIFVRNPIYGTRCSTVVRVSHAGSGEILERRYGPEGEPIGETSLRFSWP